MGHLNVWAYKKSKWFQDFYRLPNILIQLFENYGEFELFAATGSVEIYVYNASFPPLKSKIKCCNITPNVHNQFKCETTLITTYVIKFLCD